MFDNYAIISGKVFEQAIRAPLVHWISEARQSLSITLIYVKVVAGYNLVAGLEETGYHVQGTHAGADDESS